MSAGATFPASSSFCENAFAHLPLARPLPLSCWGPFLDGPLSQGPVSAVRDLETEVLFTGCRVEDADVFGGLYSLNAPKASLGCWEANSPLAKPAATTLARMFDNECCIY